MSVQWRYSCMICVGREEVCLYLLCCEGEGESDDDLLYSFCMLVMGRW